MSAKTTGKKRGPRPGTGGRPTKYPERLMTIKVPPGGRKYVSDSANAAGVTIAAWVRMMLGVEIDT